MSRGIDKFASIGAALLLPFLATGQQVGNHTPEVHPTLWLQDCNASGCKREKGSIVLDANWRWINKNGQNCYTNQNTWDPASCSDPCVCAKTCSLEGADYNGTYGITKNAKEDGVSLQFVTQGPYSTNYGSRVYVMDSEDTYKKFQLKNREFSIDVDSSNLPCGLNGAVYFVEMDRRGDWDGKGNSAGAKYGTGYCDAQCPHDIKFIKGEANVLNWNSTANPPVGKWGTCCSEMDIWEANSQATAVTPHPCSELGLVKCKGITCGDTEKGERYKGICDKDGCDLNPFRMGNRSFYGPGASFEVDSAKPMTVVTQFLTSDGTDTGDLVEIRRVYVQDGKVIENSQETLLGGKAGGSISDGFCSKQKAAFGDVNDFAAKGALREMGKALDRGMVLVLSLWDDAKVEMLWLDSVYPTDEPKTKPGVWRGPCKTGPENSPAYVRAHYPDAHVAFSAIKVGKINTTFDNGASSEDGHPAAAVYI